MDIEKALGKPHSLWCAFAKFYEHHGDVGNARVVFEKAVQVPFKYVDDLAQVGGVGGGENNVCVCVSESMCVRIFVCNARVVFKKVVQVPFK